MVVNRMTKRTEELKDFRSLTAAEIEAKEKEFKQELFNLRFQLATGQLADTARLRKVRKSIARIKTVLREQELSK